MGQTAAPHRLCSFTSYYVGRPSMRVVDETYFETVFELQPDQIKVRAAGLAKWLLQQVP